jgi:hypothetical protein
LERSEDGRDCDRLVDDGRALELSRSFDSDGSWVGDAVECMSDVREYVDSIKRGNAKQSKIAQRMRSDYKAITQRLRKDCEVVTERSSSD